MPSVRRVVTHRARTGNYRDLDYEDRLKEPKLPSLEKRRIRNDLVLTHKIIYNQIDLEASQLLNSSPEDQDLDGHHLDFFNKPGEPVDEGTVLHAELLSTGTVYHLQ